VQGLHHWQSIAGTNSTLNVFPKHLLVERLVDSMYILPNIMTTWAYDGSPRKMMGTIEIELFISLQVILVTLQMTGIHPSYNILLESL